MMDLSNENQQVYFSDDLPEVKLKYDIVEDINERPQLTNPQDVFHLLLSIWDKDQISMREEFIVLLMNNAKRLLGWSRISSGGKNATIVEPTMVYQVALLANAHSIILAHNHPSGRMEASTADISLTKRLKEVGRVLGIEVDDHLIITPSSFISMRGEKLI